MAAEQDEKDDSYKAVNEKNSFGVSNLVATLIEVLCPGIILGRDIISQPVVSSPSLLANMLSIKHKVKIFPHLFTQIYDEMR